ncbi:uncharacterized protein LOC110668265 [Hevea brasiliensis]|uniref:uncharacterized protein LOC110668265 n=1 Tax=Hevea brasiliensis TaxID=3981 RepID=UPI0025D7F4BE|nr:uncharacterized protein LOC110668265 [Hevea brasiliensis]
MSYLNRVYMAASVAVVQGHADQGYKWTSSFKSLQHGKRRLFPTGESSELRPLAGAAGSDRDGVPKSPRLDGVRENDESFRRVMYLNCWGQG